MTDHYKTQDSIPKAYSRLDRILVPFGWRPRAVAYHGLRLPVSDAVRGTYHQLRFLYPRGFR